MKYADLYVVMSFHDEWNWSQAALYCCSKSIGQDKETYVDIVRKGGKWDRFMISIFKQPRTERKDGEELTPLDLQYIVDEFAPEAIAYYDKALRERFIPSLYQGAGI